MTDDARPRAGWGWREALAVVVTAHVALILVGGLILQAGGWVVKVGNDYLPVPATGQILATTPFWIVAIAGSWWVSGRDGADARTALGVSLRPVDVPLGIAAGVIAQWVLIPIVYWPLLRLVGSDTTELEKAARGLVDASGGVGGTVALVAMTCVLAPIAEETMYRGLVQRGLAPFGGVVAVGATSLLFAAMHFQMLQLVGLAIFGAVSGVLVWRTGRLGPGIVAHMAFNASTVIPLLLRR